MGIDSWVLRTTALTLILDSEGPIDGATKSLLKDMLKCLGLSESEVSIKQNISRWSHTTRLVWIAGLSAAQRVLNTDLSSEALQKAPHYYQGIPVVVTASLTQLLREPKGKKQLYASLLLIKQLLCE